ncbi:response regulator [Pararhodospirillum photometricum]|uniref:Sensor protein n=1 Tax=Pararhodospirillum photometricum DSM 122 TaxID=1150469 RepID=H6SKR2_PARPM|nr:response regulator [Pararhodospirillum photometricum]CCG08577.1 Sensor protein [Pararhodospirillum photometricum DSM 122]
MIETRPLRILLAEDNVTNQQVAAGRLRKMGHRVDIVANGAEAVAAVQAFPYDLVFMDIQMPEMDGYEATALIRALPGPQGRLPIVAMTANAQASDRERCLATGMNDYIAKPFQQHTLQTMLDLWGLPPEAAEPALPAPPPDPSPPETGLIDPDIVADLLDVLGDEEIQRLAALFFEREMPISASLQPPTTEEEAAVTSRVAHRLKGASGNLGFCAIAAAATQIELACREGRLGDCPPLIADLRRVFEASRVAWTENAWRR